MAQVQEALSKRIGAFEKELRDRLEEKERAFRYRWIRGKAKFEAEAIAEHKKLKASLLSYLRTSRIPAALSAPIIYAGVIPFGLLDLFLIAFQGICFPIYGVPKVKRSDYIVFDRGSLKYLNALERLNCLYCSYGNGLFAFATEVAARTEQHWCPIKHAHRLRSPHSRYSHFIDYGDAQRYKRDGEIVRNDFVDLRTLMASKPSPKPADQ